MHWQRTGGDCAAPSGLRCSVRRERPTIGRRSGLPLSRSPRRAEARQGGSRRRPSAGGLRSEMCVRNHAAVKAGPRLVGGREVLRPGRARLRRSLLHARHRGIPMLSADPKRHAPNYGAMSPGQLEELARERQMLAHYGWRPYLHNPGLKRWLHRVDLPTLVVWGEADRFAQPSYGQSLAAALPAAELMVIRWAGPLSRDRAVRSHHPRNRRLVRK